MINKSKSVSRSNLLSLISGIIIILIIFSSVPATAQDENGESTTYDVIGRYGLLWENPDAHIAEIWRVRWSPDSTKIVSASLDGTAAVFDVATGDILMKLEDHDGIVRIAEYSPDGTKIATASDDKTIRIWDAETGSLLDTWEGHTGAVLFLNWSYQGDRLVSCSGFDIQGVDEGNKEVIMWQAETGAEIFRIEYHQDDIMEVSFSPDGSMIASSSDDREIGIWDAYTGDQVKILTGSLSGVLSVQWSPDGRYLSTGSRYHWLRIWDTTTWEQISAFSDPTSHCIRTSSWSADMSVLLTTGTSNEIIIWNPDDGEVIRQIPGPTTTRCAGDYIISVQFSPDNTYFAFGTSMAHSVRVYGMGGIGNSEPGPLEENVRITTMISITSNIPLDSATINDQTFEVYDQDGRLVPGTLSYHETTFAITFVPSQPLDYGTQYHVFLSGDVEDNSAQPIGLDYTFNFRTEAPPEAQKKHQDDSLDPNLLLRLALGIVIIILIIILLFVMQKRSKRFDW